jgi:Catalase
MQNQTNTLVIGQEYPLPGEAAAIQEIEQITSHQVQQEYQAGDRPARRDAHAKHHGCVKAEFTVEANLPAEYKVGVFQPGKTFTACIRFSNGSGKPQPDAKGDGRGMAIKLFGVEGEKILADEKHALTQDFVMINHPVFFIRNLPDYIDFFHATTAAKGKQPFQFFFPGLNPFKWRLREFSIARAIQGKKIPSPLSIQYWSMTPYKLGARAYKFSARPVSINPVPQPDFSANNYLREIMVEQLKSQEFEFDFLAQVQTDASAMPIEDPTVEWKAPFVKIATVKIKPQTFDSAEQMEFCENLSYTPWHSLPEHQPLGGVNRCRNQVYQTIAKLRHELNHVVKQEPTVEDFLNLFGR